MAEDRINLRNKIFEKFYADKLINLSKAYHASYMDIIYTSCNLCFNRIRNELRCNLILTGFRHLDRAPIGHL